MFELLQDLSMDALNKDESDEENSSLRKLDCISDLFGGFLKDAAKNLSMKFDGRDLLGSLLKNAPKNFANMSLFSEDEDESDAGSSLPAQPDADDLC